jgi:hypothetical protein
VTLRGTVQRAAAGAVLVLERKGKEWARTTLDTSLGFVFPDLLPGAYALRVEGTTFSQPVDLTSESHEVVIALALPEPEPAQSRSVITGVVTGGAGQVVMLLRKSDGEEWVTMARDDGSFRFVDLPPGDYSAQVFPQGTRIDSLLLDGRNQPFVELAYAGWGYTVRTAEDVQKIGAIVVAVAGTVGARVQAHAADWSSETAVTGSAPEYGPYACIITPLEAEHYIVTIDSDRILGDDDRPAQLEARVQVDKRSIPLVEFVFTDIDAPLEWWEPFPLSTIIMFHSLTAWPTGARSRSLPMAPSSLTAWRRGSTRSCSKAGATSPLPPNWWWMASAGSTSSCVCPSSSLKRCSAPTRLWKRRSWRRVAPASWRAMYLRAEA